MKTSVVSHNLHNRRALAPACQTQPFPPLPGQFHALQPHGHLSVSPQQGSFPSQSICSCGSLNLRSFLQLFAWLVQSSLPRFQHQCSSLTSLSVTLPPGTLLHSATSTQCLFVCFLWSLLRASTRIQHSVLCKCGTTIYLCKSNGLMKEFLVRRWGWKEQQVYALWRDSESSPPHSSSLLLFPTLLHWL